MHLYSKFSIFDNFIHRMNWELSGMTSQIPSISPTARMPMSGSDHKLWKFITLERIGRLWSNFHSLIFWFFFMHCQKENPRGGFPFKLKFKFSAIYQSKIIPHQVGFCKYSYSIWFGILLFTLDRRSGCHDYSSIGSSQ